MKPPIIYQIVKEYYTSVEGLEELLKGRIIQHTESTSQELQYSFELSHYCASMREKDAANEPRSNSMEETRDKLFECLEKFTLEGAWKNEVY